MNTQAITVSRYCKPKAEDSRRVVQAAKAAGLTCYAIPDELTRQHDFSMADKVLDSIRELPNLIL